MHKNIFPQLVKNGLDFNIRIMYSLGKCSFAIGNHSVGI